MGRQDTGVEACAVRWRSGSNISDGPVAQFRPMTSTSIAWRATRAAPTSVPGSIVPVSSMVTWHWTGRRTPARRIARRAPLMAALAWRRSNTVSTRIRSAPPSMRADGLFVVGVPQVGVAGLAERREFGTRADAAGHPAGLVRGRVVVGRPPGERHGGEVELADPVALAVLGQYRGEGAEGVGLDHVAAHLVERAVDPFDGVGSGHDQEFVAPLQIGTPEVLGGQLLHLEVGPHGAVEHDDALVGGLEVARFGAEGGHSPPTIVGDGVGRSAVVDPGRSATADPTRVPGPEALRLASGR